MARKKVKTYRVKVTENQLATTKNITEYEIRGTDVNTLELEDNHLFCIIDAQGATVFSVPVWKLIECVAVESVRTKPKLVSVKVDGT